jgi:hypothetical protein
MSEKTEKKGRKETFCRREKQTAPKQGSSSTSGLKIKRKTPVKPMSFTYMARPLTQIMVHPLSNFDMDITLFVIPYTNVGKKTIMSKPENSCDVNFIFLSTST